MNGRDTLTQQPLAISWNKDFPFTYQPLQDSKELHHHPDSKEKEKQTGAEAWRIWIPDFCKIAGSYYGISYPQSTKGGYE